MIHFDNFWRNTKILVKFAENPDPTLFLMIKKKYISQVKSLKMCLNANFSKIRKTSSRVFSKLQNYIRF